VAELTTLIERALTFAVIVTPVTLVLVILSTTAARVFVDLEPAGDDRAGDEPRDR
jgi:hypothetical protein